MHQPTEHISTRTQTFVRISGLPSHVNATELQKYPMYTGPWRPSGNLTITLANTSSVRVSSSNVAGLPFSSFGNIFLHEGHSCDDIGEQLPSPITRVNDWGAINNFYFVDDNGQADISLSVEGYPLSSIVNRTLVLQDEQADILSCATTFVDAKGTGMYRVFAHVCDLEPCACLVCSGTLVCGSRGSLHLTTNAHFKQARSETVTVFSLPRAASPSNVHVIETVVTPRGAVSDSKVVFELAVTAQAILDSEEAQKSWAKALAEDDDRLQVMACPFEFGIRRGAFHRSCSRLNLRRRYSQAPEATAQ